MDGGGTSRAAWCDRSLDKGVFGGGFRGESAWAGTWAGTWAGIWGRVGTANLVHVDPAEQPGRRHRGSWADLCLTWSSQLTAQ